MDKLDILIDESRRQTDALNNVAHSLESLADALKGLTITREIIRETVSVKPPVSSDAFEPDLNVVSSVSGQRMDSIEPQLPAPRIVVIEGKTYDSPKLFMVIDWLNDNPDKQGWSVRKIADETGVSKSWVAVAKKYFETK